MNALFQAAIEEYIESRGETVAQWAGSHREARRAIADLALGKRELSVVLSVALQHEFGRPASFWLRLAETTAQRGSAH